MPKHNEECEIPWKGVGNREDTSTISWNFFQMNGP
jgi:hypothetical protein